MENEDIKLKKIEIKGKNGNKLTRKFSLFCLNPALRFVELKKYGICSFILTSGTLSPIDFLEKELKVNFEFKLENDHVINETQVNFCVLKNSLQRDHIPFDFRLANRNDNIEMIMKLGESICDILKVSQKGSGVLCFFTSYAFMQSCLDLWHKRNIFDIIKKFKDIFRDERVNKDTLIKTFNQSCSFIDNDDNNLKGGILFSVLQGTFSEGIDFKDEKARMVIIIGIPYPNLEDIKVNLKRDYLEYNYKFNKNDPNKIKGIEWYENCAIKSINQAMGRVIRHHNDYGNIILIDVRYDNKRYIKIQ